MGKPLPLTHWPVADRMAFAALFAEGGLLDDRGPLAHWRAPSRDTMQRQYGLWLHWVSMAAPEVLLLDPVQRATADRLRAWLASMDGLAPATLLGYVGAILRLCRSIAPDRGWTAQQAILSALHRDAKRRGAPRKNGRILSSDVLFKAGARLVQDNAGPIIHPDQAVRIRDGAMICLLALMPMRRRALSELVLGTSLRVAEGQMMICLDGSMTKNGQPWEATVPDAACEILADYLWRARPVLAARKAGDQTAVWLGRHGAPLGLNQFTRAITVRTGQLLGTPVSPHLFRDAAATTLARASSTSARLIKPILGHSTTRIAEGHYIRADTIAAGRGLASALEALKRQKA
ncbi:tyrosine-type recombinase/integrase [Maliponia aquimaris]|uniref:Site-specific tyrosine recombinase XerC n=1 Tax=Maliponia aquimaris TaxID=1673631 RepID=A0A238JSH7_9RHOB|nr:site-specific integrase [Maliponia aquimaris]SMX33423.1 site-specific tyrosine recombinase XerC [Maliponia aquimaris]